MNLSSSLSSSLTESSISINLFIFFMQTDIKETKPSEEGAAGNQAPANNIDSKETPEQENMEVQPPEPEIDSSDIKVGFVGEETHPEVPNMTETSTESKSPKIIIFVLLGLVLLVGAYAAFSSMSSGSKQDNDFGADPFGQQEQFTDVDVDTSASTIYSDYLGTYIDAKFPTGWQIIEHKDGEGTDMLVEDGSFTGLTGLSILDEMEQEVFKMYAVWGIGGIEVCSSVAKFPDTPQTYIERINDLTIEYNENTDSDEAMPVVSEFEQGEYTSFKFLDYRGRRVDSTYYWNDLANTNLSEFHPLCGLSGSFLVFNTLSFETETSTGGSYGLEVTQGLTEETLVMLDYVMSSIVLK